MNKATLDTIDGAELDAAVWKLLKRTVGSCKVVDHEAWGFGICSDPARFNPSSNWFDGGPIVERERIAISFDSIRHLWGASCKYDSGIGLLQATYAEAPTPLIAAMRAFVMSKDGQQESQNEND